MEIKARIFCLLCVLFGTHNKKIYKFSVQLPTQLVLYTSLFVPCFNSFLNSFTRFATVTTLLSTVVNNLGGSLAVVRSYTLGCEPLVTGNLAMGLTIRSSHKQELSSVYQFIDVLYSLCIYEALRH